MPSILVGYVAGSGFTPLVSGGLFWSGHLLPVGGIRIYAPKLNSGSIYISLSGGNAFSGQISTLVTSGGPTIKSGGFALSGGYSAGIMDGFEMAPGDTYFVPRMAIPNTGANSGIVNLCVGADLACSGTFGRVAWEVF